MRRSNIVMACLAVVMALGLCACGQTEQAEEKKPDFSQAGTIAQLSTLECSFHNVAEFYDDGTQIFGGLSVGYKKAWFEYDGEVTLGVDASKVSVSEPDEDGKVTITLPEAEVHSCRVIPGSIGPVYSSTGLITILTANDKTTALDAAQNQMVDSAKGNSDLMGQARARAGILLKAYAERVGDAMGKTYKVYFVDEEGNSLRIIDGEVEELVKSTRENSTDSENSQQDAGAAQGNAGTAQ